MKRRISSLLTVAMVLVLLAATLINHYHQNTNPFAASGGNGYSDLKSYYSQSIKWRGCYQQFECATYQVPIDYSDLTLGKFDIAVMRHTAKNAKQSLVINPGGPGGSGVDYVYSYQEAFTPAVIKNFDIVGFDPRGVGESAPILCLSNAETDQLYSEDSYPKTSAELAKLQSETKTFADKCSSANPYLKYYSTANAARDMDILRALIGDSKLNFLGKSYGTYLGALYAQLFPNNVGRFVLDGAVDPTLNSADQSVQQAIGFDSAFNAFAADCVKQSSCVFNSDASIQIQNKLTEIRKNPIAVGDRKLTESLAVYGIAFGLYDKEFGWSELRSALKDLFNGDGKALLSMADTYNRRDSKGNYTSNDASSLPVIACNDFPPTGSDVEAIKSAAPIFGKYVAYSEMDCEYLPKPKYELITAPIQLQSAVLVIGTSNDPATPYQWAVKLASLLTNSVLISVSGEGHTGYNRDTPCVDQAVEKYLISGVIPAQNLACSA